MMELSDVVSWMSGDRIWKFVIRTGALTPEWVFVREREYDRLAEELCGYCELECPF